MAGVITHRQRPETAAGVTFISLEDDTGLINVVCSMNLWTRHKKVARSAVALLVRGYLESADGAINVVAHELEDLQITAAPAARNFR